MSIHYYTSIFFCVISPYFPLILGLFLTRFKVNEELGEQCVVSNIKGENTVETNSEIVTEQVEGQVTDTVKIEL